MLSELINLNNTETCPNPENIIIIKGSHSRLSEFVNEKLFQHFDANQIPYTLVDIDDMPIYFDQEHVTTPVILNLSKFDEFIHVADYLNKNNTPKTDVPFYSILYPTFFENEENIRLLISLGG